MEGCVVSAIFMEDVSAYQLALLFSSSLESHPDLCASLHRVQMSGTDLASSVELWADDDTLRRVGGPTELEYGRDVHLRVLMDHSCIEVFTGSGEVLSTRVYRCPLPMQLLRPSPLCVDLTPWSSLFALSSRRKHEKLRWKLIFTGSCTIVR